MDELTPAGRVIADEIAASGPIPFSRFMEVALYHPEHGYYRHDRDPFGTQGDFYTAEQLQPVFGRLVAATVRGLLDQLGPSDETVVVELGAGRREMADAFAGFHYIPVDVGYGEMPDRLCGVVFSNEFFDAIPVDLVVSNEGQAVCERRVGFSGGHFQWDDSTPLRTAAGFPHAIRVRELQDHRIRWMERIAERLERGFVLTIDYGYTHRELIRFPEGTLMSYHRHRATEDVLACPGERDITAHVDFTLLETRGRELGLETVRFESLGQMLLRAGEADSFASALEGGSEPERLRRRMQLKSLLFGMGETFRVLLQRR